MKILGKAVASKEQAKAWAKKMGATPTFIGLVDEYWKQSKRRGKVRPEVAYVQACHETAFGRFGGVVDEDFHNPCGLKVTAGGGNYEKEAHKRFKSWKYGVRAHLDHLALYAGAEGYPRKRTPDPRHFKHLFATAPNVEDLGGKWAPREDYGDTIVKLANSLINTKLPTKFEYVSRKQWGAKAPKNRFIVSRPMEGIFVHYTSSVSDQVADHKNCAARVRGVQSFHMGPSRGWSDIAYSWLVCRHGAIYEGRGWGVAGAHTQGYNSTNHAVCFLGGDRPGTQDVPPVALKAIASVIQQNIRQGDGKLVRPHSAVNPTSCPGDELRAWIKRKGWED